MRYLQFDEDPRLPRRKRRRVDSRYDGAHVSMEVGFGTANPNLGGRWCVAYPGPAGTAAMSPLHPSETHTVMEMTKGWHIDPEPPTPIRVGNGWPE